MSLLLREKLAISSIFPLQKGGSRTPSNSKYLLSNSIGVLGVSASLSAILEVSRQRKRKKTPTRTGCFSGIKDEDDDGGDEVDLKRRCRSLGMLRLSGGCCTAGGRVDLQPITWERSDVMRAHESQHQDHSRRTRECACPQRKDASQHVTQSCTLQ